VCFCRDSKGTTKQDQCTCTALAKNGKKATDMTWVDKADVLLDLFLESSDNNKDKNMLRNLKALLREEVTKNKNRRKKQSNKIPKENVKNQIPVK
jgi:hypothetical protein